MASGSNAPFSGEFVDLENVPTLPEGVTPSEATEKVKIDNDSIGFNSNGELEVKKPSFEGIGFSGVTVTEDQRTAQKSVSHNSNTIVLKYSLDSGFGPDLDVQVNGETVFTHNGDGVTETGDIVVKGATGDDNISLEVFQEGNITFSINEVLVKNGVNQL